MAFGNPGGIRSHAPVGEINMVPLIDVMLVLLVIFLVTAPLLTHAVKIDLPQASSHPDPTPETQAIDLALDGSGRLYWNDVEIHETELPERFAEAARKTPIPELHIRADRNTRYEQVAKVMSEASTQGIAKIGFVSDPSAVPRP